VEKIKRLKHSLSELSWRLNWNPNLPKKRQNGKLKLRASPWELKNLFPQIYGKRFLAMRGRP
jgi:hypothetical protein